MKKLAATSMVLLTLFGSANLVQAAPGGHRSVPNVEAVLSKGEVAMSYHKEGEIQYVSAKIRVPYSADRVWPILANPYEFEEKISPRFKLLEVFVDKPDHTLLKCKVDIGFLMPAINYTVESHYDHGRRITFQSRAGDLKDFRGFWEIDPACDGRECDITYSLHVVPGIPIPQWLVRQGVKIELPHTLTALRSRIKDVYFSKEQLVKRTLSASAAKTI